MKDFTTIDRQQLRVLLKCYFRLSTRGRVTQSMSRGGKPRSLYFVLGMYVFMGLMNGLMLQAIQLDVFTFTVMLHSMTFFVVGMALTAVAIFRAGRYDPGAADWSRGLVSGGR